VPTAVPIAEPAPERIDALARPGGRELAVEAEGELAAARRKDGLDRAHALEDFARRYPRHPSADNALVEASAAYAAGGRDDAACGLAARATEDYPAGDAVSDALERLATCELRRGDPAAELRLLRRLVADYPRTPAAERAGARLASMQRSGP
jgi:TolA-binding protein